MQQQGQQQRDDAAAGLGDDNAAAARNGRNQEDSRCHQFCQHPNPMGVRFVYAALFLVANVLAWVIRESRVTFYQGQRLNGCHGDRDCLAADAVLVISFASFLFFLVMFFTTVSTSKLHDWRNSWHCQWWLPKAFLLGGSIIISTFTPAYWIQLYGYLT
nr:unnamed protein product [Digitaria exilis]